MNSKITYFYVTSYHLNARKTYHILGKIEFEIELQIQVKAHNSTLNSSLTSYQSNSIFMSKVRHLKTLENEKIFEHLNTKWHLHVDTTFLHSHDNLRSIKVIHFLKCVTHFQMNIYNWAIIRKTNKKQTNINLKPIVSHVNKNTTI